MGIRDKAILEILYSAGIRSGELRKLDIYDINLHDKLVHIKNPKNKKDRIVPTGDKAKSAIEEYLLKSRSRLARVSSADPKENALFLSQYGKRMSKGSIPYILRTYSKKMNLGKRITPHCLRHSLQLICWGMGPSCRHSKVAWSHASNYSDLSADCSADLKKRSRLPSSRAHKSIESSRLNCIISLSL